MGADHAGGNAEGAGAEEVAGEDVNEAEDTGKDAGGDDDLPEGEAKGLLGGGRLVEVAEYGNPDNNHEKT